MNDTRLDNLLVRVPHGLRLRVKAAAALKDETIQRFVIEALESELRTVKLPTLRSDTKGRTDAGL